MEEETKQTAQTEQTEDITQTYAYETDFNSEQLLAIKKKELKELRKKAHKDRTVRIARKTEKRSIRDENIDKIMLKLKTIKEKITFYNRTGNVTKGKIDIFGDIQDIIQNDTELLEDIERSKPVSQEDIEAEVYQPTEEEISQSEQ